MKGYIYFCLLLFLYGAMFGVILPWFYSQDDTVMVIAGVVLTMITIPMAFAIVHKIYDEGRAFINHLTGEKNEKIPTGNKPTGKSRRV